MSKSKPTFSIEGDECVVTGIATNLSGVELARWSLRVPAAAVHESRNPSAQHLRGGLGQVVMEMAKFVAEQRAKNER